MKFKEYQENLQTQVGCNAEIVDHTLGLEREGGIINVTSYYGELIISFHQTADSLSLVVMYPKLTKKITAKGAKVLLETTDKFLKTPYSKRGFKPQRHTVTVQVICGDDDSYLNKDLYTGNYYMHNRFPCLGNQTRFTQAEIDELKQRDDIAIDWNKAIIKGVDEQWH